MTEQPYHKYIFDVKNRKFVGQFEEMYANEDKEGYDSWHQEDISNLEAQMSLAILKQNHYGAVLDIGCGKGAFTNLLKNNNDVVGADISETAIAKARGRYPSVEFQVRTAQDALCLRPQWDLVVMMQVLSYIEDYKMLLKTVSQRSRNLYLTLYLPSNSIGFVKSLDELKNEITKYYSIETEILWNSETILVLAKSLNND
jgi:trans-aconitate methyltransferase